jgi:hypothetical protein
MGEVYGIRRIAVSMELEAGAGLEPTSENPDVGHPAAFSDQGPRLNNLGKTALGKFFNADH